MDKEQLIQLIEDAFKGVSRNGGVSLHETEVIDNYGTDEERQEARKKDRDGRWQDVPHKDLAEVCGIGGLSFFDPIGWRYYLPAYMIWYLSAVNADESDASSSLLYTLHRSNDDLESFDMERYETLNHGQAVAVKAFLTYIQNTEEDQWCGDGYEAKKALDSYWHQF